MCQDLWTLLASQRLERVLCMLILGGFMLPYMILMSYFYHLQMWKRNKRTTVYFLWPWACMLLPVINIICSLLYSSDNKHGDTYFVCRGKHYICITVIILDAYPKCKHCPHNISQESTAKWLVAPTLLADLSLTTFENFIKWCATHQSTSNIVLVAHTGDSFVGLSISFPWSLGHWL